MSSIPDPDQSDEVLAAEYALHLLEPRERVAFERRLDLEGGLRAAVARWSEWFAALIAEIPAVAPPAALRDRLARAIVPAARSGRRGFSLWRMLGGAGFAAAMAIALFAVLPRTPPALSPAIYIAEMQSDATQFVLLAGYHPDEAALVVNRSAGQVPAGRVIELWLIPPGATDPISLGVLPDEPSVTLTVPEPLRDDLAGATLAISDEPPGGSTTGAPTGDILASGPLADV